MSALCNMMQMAAASDQGSATAAVGDVVVIHGLRTHDELNGQQGTLVSFDATKGRWTLQLAVDARPVSIAPGNVQQQPVGATCFFFCFFFFLNFF
jgi:hypothetical protein